MKTDQYSPASDMAYIAVLNSILQAASNYNWTLITRVGKVELRVPQDRPGERARKSGVRVCLG